MASTRRCINSAGPDSRVYFPSVPQLEVELTLGEEACKAVSCWGYRVGEILTAADPEQTEYRARITAIENKSLTVIPFQQVRRSESLLRITLFQALPEKERFEMILQKATELGVARIVPYVSERSTTLSERDAGQKKSHRWPEVILRAARQCRRAEIPELSPVVDWGTALEEGSLSANSLICYEGEGTLPLTKAVEKISAGSVALFVGPEGGFRKAEIEEANRLGFKPVCLGPRILRTETAAIIGAGIIQFAAGDLG